MGCDHPQEIEVSPGIDRDSERFVISGWTISIEKDGDMYGCASLSARRRPYRPLARRGPPAAALRHQSDVNFQAPAIIWLHKDSLVL
jgi:hypothetical protein